jgi:tRNA pseudouridine55 synthase
VGRTGTLDPMATGVLVLLLGTATRLAQFILQDKKTYRGIVHLGVETSTYDAFGEVIAERPANFTQKKIIKVIDGFKGSYAQVPPMYSAIKVKGKKLYDLARQGKSIPREPRTVTIYNIEVISWHANDPEIEVTCSTGTYIRSLAHDIGDILGCGAHLKQLIRIHSHGYSVTNSYSLDDLKQRKLKGDLFSTLRPSYDVLTNMPVVYLTAVQETAVRYGKKINLNFEGSEGYPQARDMYGELIGILIPVDSQLWRPKAVFPPASDG